MQKFGNTKFGISGSALFDNGYRKFNDEKRGRFNIHLKHKSANYEGLSYGINLNSGLNQTIGFVLWENATNGVDKTVEVVPVISVQVVPVISVESVPLLSSK